MTYFTIDTLPDLSTTAMNAAIPLTFAPYLYPSLSPHANLEATVAHAGPNPPGNNVFYFNGVANAFYDVYSYSARDPSPVKIYDMDGNAIASDGIIDVRSAGGSFGMDALFKFVAPYSGRFYLDAGWHSTMTNPFATLHVLGDTDRAPSVPKSITGTAAGENLGFASDGNDAVDGGAGIDTLYYFNPRSQYSVVRSGSATTVTSKMGGEGIDVLHNVERLAFHDGVKAPTFVDLRYVDLTESLYVGYFGRAADQGGLKAFQAQLAALNAPSTVKELNALYATDAAIKQLVDSFGTSSESQALYGGDTKAFVTAIYTNLLNRAPQQSGLDFWSKAIDSGSLTRASASLSIMAGAQANDTAQGRTDAHLLDLKLNVAANFTFAMDNEQLAAAYDGAGPAAAVRTMLRSVTANTNVDDFQSTVQQVLGKMAHLPGARAPLAETAHDDPVPILLAGVDNSHDGAALFA